MEFLLPLLIGIVVGGLIGWFVALSRRAPADTTALTEAVAAAARAQSEVAVAQSAAAGAQASADELRRQVEQLTVQRDADTEKARADALEQSRVLQALSPVQETLRSMQTKLSELERERTVQFGTLTEQLSQNQRSGEQLRATTESLASALRNNGTRGVWGETQLRNVVEAAGLTNRVDFDLQTSIATEAGRGRPDMIVRLPGGKSIAVDAKVPFDAYLEANAIPLTSSDIDLARRKALLDKHVKAIRGHIDALAARGYWEGLDSSPEFVVAFIPSESLLAAALESDPTLLDYSFRKRVALASPVNLWAVLKTVALTWHQDLMTEDAKKLLDLSKTLYQRLSTLSEHSEGLRRSIERTVESYNKFANSLESRVLVTARQLNRMDDGKILAEPEQILEAPRALTSPELQLEIFDDVAREPELIDGSRVRLTPADESGAA